MRNIPRKKLEVIKGRCQLKINLINCLFPFICSFIIYSSLLISLLTAIFPRDVGGGVKPDSEGRTGAGPGPDIQRYVQLSRLLHRSDGQIDSIIIKPTSYPCF